MGQYKIKKKRFFAFLLFPPISKILQVNNLDIDLNGVSRIKQVFI